MAVSSGAPPPGRRRPVALVLALLAAPLAAQPALDVSGSAGWVLPGNAPLYPRSAGGQAVSAAAAPGLPLGARVVATAALGPGDASGDGRVRSVGFGTEVPLSGGRNGLFLALGAAYVDLDNDGPTACRADPDCFYEYAEVASYAGLAATVGLGARIPVVSRLYVEPAASAFVWDEVLPSARLGVGWRLR